MKLLLAFIPFLFFAYSGIAQDRTTEFDALLKEALAESDPGVAVLVAKGEQVLYRKARGMADLEKKEAMTPDHIFRIGSITKQFTAVAILQLMEQGKLKLDDDITKHISEYPTKGKRITVEMLLNHTSGIASYTSMPGFDGPTQASHRTPEEVMAFFMNEPLEFEPGTSWNYNNSGYFLLGMIIERISGKSYGAYVEEEIFAKLGMKRSFYGSDTLPMDRVAQGYSRKEDGFVPAEYLSMTWPFAAGALYSSVDDMHTWNSALHAGKVVKRENLKRAHSAHKLADGRDTQYGFGWMFANIQQVPTVEHGGGINGFVSDAIYLPSEELYVVVLTNRESGLANDLSARLAAIAIGKPYVNKPVPMPTEQLKAFEGVYVNEDGSERVIRVQDGMLTSQRDGGQLMNLGAMGNDRFYFDGSLTQLGFERSPTGGISGLTMIDRTQGETQWTRNDKPLPALAKETELTAEQLQPLLGVYELQPGFTITVTNEGSQLFIQATNQPRFEAYATAPTSFFLKVVDARMEFHLGADGKAEKMVLFQAGQELPGKRVG